MSQNFLINQVLWGDCEVILSTFPKSSVDLIFTSPPYADRRKKTDVGIPAKDYVEWFMPKAQEFFRVLKPTGTFILNIKEITDAGEKQSYVLELILEMKRQGWFWTEEFIWHKKNSYPGKWPNRFRDSWERLLQFNRTKNFKMFQKRVMIPIGDWSQNRLKKLSERDKMRDESRVGSGFGKNVSNWLNRKKVYPTNVLHMATECSNQGHSATFPASLPEWFIRLFTDPGDLVLDPFCGSGTTAIVSQKLRRNFMAIDIKKEYCLKAREKLHQNGLQNLVL